MYNTYALFKDSDFEVRKSISQKDFETRHMDFLCSFPDMVDRAFDRLGKEIYPIIEVHSRDKNMAAILISGFLRGQMIEKYLSYCQGTASRFKMKIDGAWVYIKKFKSKNKKKPSNITTDANSMILNQHSFLEYDDGNVFLGYTAQSDMLRADGVYAVYIKGGNVEWSSDLRQLAAAYDTNKVIHLQAKKEVALKEGTVQLKGKRSA